MKLVSKNQAEKKVIVEINSQPCSASRGQMIIQVADAHDIYIPRFCYHKKLSVAANCRMCLVEIEGAMKPSPACATSVVDGMKVFTKSPATISYQKKIMEFLLINHPLDCPICDQGGECELQDIAMGYGSGVSQYNETKRTFNDLDLGPLVATEMTRCIQCTRCVRFGEEVSGDKELGLMGRGDHTEISTYVEKTLDSELSGNIIDLCPVGALTSKPFRFSARAWELKQYETISGADSVGANIYAHVRRDHLMRIVPKENEAINETWLADKDRFIYEGVHHRDRVRQPMIKKGDGWQEVSWEEALDFVKVSIEQTKEQSGAESIAALASDSCTNEELYLLQKLLRRIGSNNIDTRLKQASTRKGIHAGFGFDCSLMDIEKADAIFLFGSNLRKEIPLINHRVHKAQKNGAKVMAVNSAYYPFNYPVESICVETSEMIYALVSLLKSISQRLSVNLSTKSLKKLATSVKEISVVQQFATQLLEAKNPILIMGFDALLHRHLDQFDGLFKELKRLLGARGGSLSIGANAKGALLSGATPDYLPGLNKAADAGKCVRDIFMSGTKLLLLAGIEIEEDLIASNQALEALRDIDFVVAFSAFANESMRQYADIILPMTTHFETAGSMTNIFGIVQHFDSVIPPLYDSKPLWKILRVLSNLLNLEGFEYNGLGEVYHDFDSITQGKDIIDTSQYIADELPILKQGLSVQVCLSMYKTSSLLRRADPLQRTKDAKYYSLVRISLEQANNLELGTLKELKILTMEGDHVVPFVVDDNLADNTLIIPFSIVSTCSDAISDVTIESVLEKGKEP